MLTAVCMNPSFDRTVTVQSLRVGEVNRILSVRQDVGGKGINVAVTARRLGMESRVIGCAGEAGIDTVRAALDKEGVQHAFLPVAGAVRLNTKVVSLSGTPVTELNEPGAAVNEEARQAFFAMTREQLRDSRYVVLTGSLPTECPADTYRLMMEMMPEHRWVLDVSGKALLSGLSAKPFLVKPNREELEATLGKPLHTMQELCMAAQELLQRGAQHVLLSLGKQGALWVNPEKMLFAPAMPVTVHSTVGAGDAMVGGVMTALDKTDDITQALIYGTAAGNASVMTEGTQLIRAEDFARLLPQVRIQDVGSCFFAEYGQNFPTV